MKETISLYIVEDYFLTKVAYKHFFEKDDLIKLYGDFDNAEDCINAMNNKPVDIILMDLGLPNMNGIEATKLLKNKYPETKVIILTSHESENEVLATLASGARGYVLKDTELSDLRKVILAVHFGAFWFDAKIDTIPINYLPKPISTDFNNLYPEPEIKDKLTEREFEVLKLVIEGKSNPEIAKEIVVSTNTAKAHVCNILSKLCVESRIQAAVKAIRENLF